MTDVAAIPPALIVLAAALLLPFLGRRVGHALGFVATAVVVPLVWLAPADLAIDGMVLGFEATVHAVDEFSRVMGLIFGFIGAVAVLYSYASDADTLQTAFALSYVGSSLGAVFAGDWLTLLIWWELMAVTSTLLVWHYGGAAIRAGFRYAIFHGIGGSLLIAAVVWHYAEVGSMAITADGLVGGVPAVLAAIGIGVNVGFVGLHTWLPDTYPRPHVAASVFLCVYTTKTGVYAMYRAFPEGHIWIAYMGGAMAVFGAFTALLQSDMRRLLSYHIQSQVGYMIAGVGIGTTLASAGAFGHVFNHILYKGLLFMTVGVIIYRTGQEDLKKIGGLGRKMPITAITFTVAALSIAGFPGFNGFVSKGMVLGAAHHEHIDPLWYMLLLGGVGTFLSFMKLGYFAFVEGEYGGMVRDANLGQSVGLVTVAGLCVLYGVYPDALYAILPGSEYHYTAYTVDHAVESLILFTIALVGFAVLRGPLGRPHHLPDVDAIYNPLAFHGTRILVRAVSAIYGAADRAAVGIAATATWLGSAPETAAASVPGSERVLGDEDERHRPLRAGIGTSILILIAVLTVVQFLVL